MHFFVGLVFLLIGLVVATRRVRARWWTIATLVLAFGGALWSTLNLLGATDGLGELGINIVGWGYVALCAMTMLAAMLVLERRGPRGVQQSAIIGETPFDGDPNDSDDAAEEIEAAQAADEYERLEAIDGAEPIDLESPNSPR